MMLGKNASMERFEWPRVGTDYLQGDPESLSNEDLVSAINGLGIGFNMALQELGQLLREEDLPFTHNKIIIEDARVGTDNEIDVMSTATSYAALNSAIVGSNPRAYVTDNGKVRGAAIVGNGPIVALVANNINAKNANAINQIGFIGRAAMFENLFVTTIKTRDDVAYFSSGHFTGDNASSATAFSSVATVLPLTRQTFTGDSVPADAEVSAGTYSLTAQVSVRHVTTNTGAGDLTATVFLDATAVGQARIARPLTSHGDCTTAVVTCMFTAVGGDPLTISVQQDAAAAGTSEYKYNQEKTGFVVTKLPT